MKHYKTIKGFIKGIKKFADVNSADLLKGYDKLSEEDKTVIKFLIADIHNYSGELEHILNE